MSSMVPPAASTAAFKFSQTCLVCSAISPMPAMLPSARRAVMPEMNTNRPVPSIAVACEKTPLGWRSLGLEIWVLGMSLFLYRRLEWIESNSEVCCKTRQHRDYRRIEPDKTGGTLTPAPFRLTRSEHGAH